MCRAGEIIYELTVNRNDVKTNGVFPNFQVSDSGFIIISNFIDQSGTFEMTLTASHTHCSSIPPVNP